MQYNLMFKGDPKQRFTGVTYTVHTMQYDFMFKGDPKQRSTGVTYTVHTMQYDLMFKGDSKQKKHWCDLHSTHNPVRLDV